MTKTCNNRKYWTTWRGQPSAKQAIYIFFGSEVTASVTHPVEWRDTKVEHLYVGVSELAELNILREISKSQILAVFGQKILFLGP